MIYMAEIISDTVQRVIVVNDASWPAAVLGGTWIETKEDGSIRGKFACIGDIYDPVTDTFSSPEDKA